MQMAENQAQIVKQMRPIKRRQLEMRIFNASKFTGHLAFYSTFSGVHVSMLIIPETNL
jgi:hypothetical protein